MLFSAHRFLAVAVTAAMTLTIAPTRAQLQPEFPVVELSSGMYRVEAELAHTPQTRQLGLMHRREMAEHRGMVFVFDTSARHCMWMRNTLIPLSVAFLDDDGKIVNIEDMAPLTDDSHCAAAPVRYALEMNRGWFAARGIAAGARVRGLGRLPDPL